MNSLSGISTFRTQLSDWYGTHHRDLPWRQQPDPYKVWLSEIILQQTRVEQGLPYFESIYSKFPDVRSLAAAPLDELLKCWQGLGYYSRARNMHAAAKQVMDEFNGRFPSNHAGLLKLKGVGEYTAAAISSIVYGEAKAVVDGNVYRFLSRLYDVDVPINSSEGKRLFASLADELLDAAHPALHNQAMMEFGALQCVPVRPGCNDCPFSDRCLGRASQRVDMLPVKNKVSTKTERHFLYLVPTNGTHTWLHQRMEKDIWQHLWEFPLLEHQQAFQMEALWQEPLLDEWFGSDIQFGQPLSYKHILSHRIIHATFLPVRIRTVGRIPSDWIEVAWAEIDAFAVSRLTENYLKDRPVR